MTIYTRPDDVPAFAEAGDRVQPSNAEIKTGWPLSPVPPSRQRFNWILNFCANAIRYFMQRGIAEWNIAEDYPQFGRVQEGGLTYIAKVANIGMQPSLSPTEWERWGYSASQLLAFLSPITPSSSNNRVGINNATPLVTLDITATDAIKFPVGSTAQRPANAAGRARFNNTTGKFEGNNGTAWAGLGGGAVGGGLDEVFYENGQVVTTSYTITAGKNAMVAGPLTVNDGVTITVPDGSTLTIV